jgi:hypothetical protein
LYLRDLIAKFAKRMAEIAYPQRKMNLRRRILRTKLEAQAQSEKRGQLERQPWMGARNAHQGECARRREDRAKDPTLSPPRQSTRTFVPGRTRPRDIQARINARRLSLVKDPWRKTTKERRKVERKRILDTKSRDLARERAVRQARSTFREGREFYPTPTPAPNAAISAFWALPPVPVPPPFQGDLAARAERAAHDRRVTADLIARRKAGTLYGRGRG